MTAVNYAITVDEDDINQLQRLAADGGGWQDTNVYMMESKPRLAHFKRAAKALKIKIAEIEETKYSDYGVLLSCKVIYKG